MLLEIWLLTLLGSTTDNILGCWSISGGHWGVWLHHYASRESNSSSGKNKKRKEKKKSNKTRFVLYSSSVSLAELGFPRGKGNIFLWMIMGLDESFQIFCWMCESDCLGNYVKKSVRKWTPTQLMKCYIFTKFMWHEAERTFIIFPWVLSLIESLETKC